MYVFAVLFEPPGAGRWTDDSPGAGRWTDDLFFICVCFLIRMTVLIRPICGRRRNRMYVFAFLFKSPGASNVCVLCLSRDDEIECMCLLSYSSRRAPH